MSLILNNQRFILIFRNITSNFHTTVFPPPRYVKKKNHKRLVHEPKHTASRRTATTPGSIVHGTQVNRILMTKQYQPAVIERTPPTVMH